MSHFLPLFLLCGFAVTMGVLLGLFASIVFRENAREQLAEERAELAATRELLGLAERRVESLQRQLRGQWNVRAPLPPVRQSTAWVVCQKCRGSGCSACRGVA